MQQPRLGVRMNSLSREFPTPRNRRSFRLLTGSPHTVASIILRFIPRSVSNRSSRKESGVVT